ncbi:MAG: hypothetical protein EOP50_01035 [Sphingobacteriales bacterium]|nr:MAG: hypothetical protein EOP50_01035 [Sphingobacteriales bacterium]
MADTNIHSSYYEKMVEHLFISEILETAWLSGQLQIEVSRAEIDNSGYDIVLECNNIIRHVQLKCSDENATTASQNVNIKLATKPSSCIIWITRAYLSDRSKYQLSYSFFGTEAGGRLPDLSNFKVARHSRANAKGEKKERPNIRVIPKGSFESIGNTKHLLNVLFNLDLS